MGPALFRTIVRYRHQLRHLLRTAAALLLLAAWPAGAQFLPPPGGGGPIVNEPFFKAIPSTLDFGVVATGATKRLELTVQNNGVGVLALHNWAASDPFRVAQDPGLRNLNAGQSTVMYVDFAPTTAGAASGAVTFNTSVGQKAVPLSGQGEVQARFEATPNPLEFGGVLVGQRATRSLTIRNSGSGTLVVRSWATSGGGFFFTEAPSERQVGNGQTLGLDLVFQPSERGASSGRAYFSTNAGEVEVPLSGLGRQAILEVTPNPLGFGTVTVGQRSVKEFVIKNSGNLRLYLDDDDTTFPGQPFGCSRNLPGVMEPGTEFRLAVWFEPMEPGTYTSRLRIDAYADQGAIQGDDMLVEVTGKGVSPITITPASFDFGQVAVGQRSVKEVTITNVGNALWDLIKLNWTGPYELGWYPGELDPGQSGVLRMAFKPEAVGAHTSHLIIESNLGTYTVPLTGTGVAAAPPPPFTVTPSSLDFGQVPVGERVTKTITIHNTQGYPSIVTLSNIVTKPLAPAGEFTTDARALENGIPGDESRTLSLTFHPTRAGSYSATLYAEVVLTIPRDDSPSYPLGSLPLVTLTATATLATPPGSSLPAPGTAPNPSPGGTDPGSTSPGGTTPVNPTPGTSPGGTNPGTTPPGGTNPGRVSADWPVFMQGPLQAGRAEVALDLTSLTPWSVPLGSKPGGPPVVLGGVAYIGTENNGVFAIDTATRTQRWNRALPAPVRSTPAAGAEVIVVSAGGLLGLHPADGRILWQRPDIGAPDGVSPMRVGEVVYIGARGPGGLGHALYAVRAATGANAWAAPALLPLPALSTAAIEAERGLVFVAVGQPPVAGQPALGPSAVVALRVSDGGMAWPAPSVLLHAAPAALSVGRVAAAGGAQPAVFVAGGASVTALNGATGAPLWSRSLPESGLQAPPVVSTAGPAATLFVGGAGGRVYALKADTGADAPGGLGTPVAPLTGTLALAGGRLFAPTPAGVIAVDSASGARLWTGEAAAGTGVAVTDSGVCVGTTDGRLAGWWGTGTPISPAPAPPVATADLAVTQIQVQPAVYRTAGAQVRVLLANRGSAETPYRLRLRVEPGDVLIGEREGRLAAGATETVTIPWPAALMEVGARTLVAIVEAPGQADTQPGDNTVRQSVEVRL